MLLIDGSCVVVDIAVNDDADVVVVVVSGVGHGDGVTVADLSQNC